MKLWDKGYSTDKFVEEFTVGRDRELDLYLAEADVLGNMAHMKMLGSIGLLSQEDCEALEQGLKKIYKQVQAAILSLRMALRMFTRRWSLCLPRCVAMLVNVSIQDVHVTTR